jgi:dihydrofolate reductase
VAPSLQEALDLASATGKRVFVAGGGSVYEQALPLVNEMYLSTIKGKFSGDTYFPEFDPDAWAVTEVQDQPEFVFRKYCRR